MMLDQGSAVPGESDGELPVSGGETMAPFDVGTVVPLHDPHWSDEALPPIDGVLWLLDQTLMKLDRLRRDHPGVELLEDANDALLRGRESIRELKR